MFQVALPCYLGLKSGRSVSINVNKTKKHISRNIHGDRMFPQCFPVSHTGNIVSSFSFCFRDANYAYATRQGILTKIRACEHLQNFAGTSKQALIKFLQAIRSKAKFCEHFQMMGPFDTPLIATPRHRCVIIHGGS